METSREVSENTFGNDAKVLLGNITNNITTVNADPSAAHNAFLQGISETNPVDDKKRILESKGPLIYESYYWILEHNDFKKWRDDEKTGVFWIKGDPGKGKTMLLCGIIQDFENDSKVQERFAFFFCQGADARLNTATGIVKGLIYSVLRQNQKLLSNIPKKIEKEPKGYLEGTNAWATLGRIFTTIIQDPCMADFTFIIDALDECQHQESRKSLFNLIMETSNHVKWLISSRNEKEIERGLKSIENKLILELKSNAAHISNAVDAYIDRCAQDIEALEDDVDFRNKTIKLLKIKANGTFLWVTLVVQQLRDAGRPHVESILEEMPEDLESLYDEIMERSKKGWKNDKEACLVFLATVTAAKRPLHTSELYIFTSSQLTNTKVRYLPNDIEYLAKACGSFITITDNTIYFIHQSVKDYMVQKGAINIFPRGIADQHSKMFEISLKIMDKILRRNIYNIRSPGEHVDNITPPNPNPLASKEYFCAFWVDHLAHCRQSQLFQDVGILHSFLKEKYLYWLEAMILIKSLAQAVIAVQKLQNLIANYCIIEDNANPTSISPHLGKGKRGRVGHDQWIANTVRPERKPETLIKNERNETLELTRDVYRLVFSHRAIIEAFPLQIYASALTFCPSESILRKFFECPKWIVAKSEIRPSWSPCIQTIEDYESPVISVAISPDNTMLAAAAFHGIAKTWDLISGASLYSFETTNVTNVAFSPNSNQLALVVGEDLGPTYASIPVKVEIWDLITGTRLKTMDGGFESVSFSADGTLLALVGRNMIKIHNLATNVDLLTHTCHSDDVFRAVIFSSNCTQSESEFGDGGIVFQSLKSDDGAPLLAARAIRAKLATSAREMSSIEVLDLATGKCIQSIATDIYKYTKVSLSSDGMRLALAAGNASPISIWDIATGKCLQTLGGDSYAVRGMAFSADGLQLASTEGFRIYIWDIATCKRLQKFSGHAHYIRSLAYSLDGLRLVSGADDTTIKVWDLAANNSLQLFKSYPPPLEDMIMLITFSPGGRWVALVNYDNTVRLWDTATRTVLWGMKILGVINIIVFSPDNMQLAISTSDGRIGTISLWDVATGTRLRAFTGHTWDVVLIALSPRGTQLASASAHKSLRIWDTRAGTCLHTITTNCDVNSSIAFSPDGTKLGCVTDGGTIKMWDPFTGVCLQTLEDLPRLINDGFSWREYLLEKLFASSSQEQHSYYSYGVPELDISEDRTWILHGQNRALWLPPEYRPIRLKIHKNSLIIITKDNDFIHFEFCFENLNS